MMYEQQDPIIMALVPCSLVMTPVSCFYCNDDCHKMLTVFRLFGLKSCNKHVLWAKRDCNAFMHRNKLVKMIDTPVYPIFKELFSLLKNVDLNVMRSSGIIENGWKLDFGYHLEPTFIREIIGGNWSLPVTKDDLLTKQVFVKELVDLNPQLSISPALVDEVLMALNAGIYKQYELDYLAVVDQATCAVRDNDLIQTGVFNGRSMRFVDAGDYIVQNDNTVEPSEP